MRLAKPAAPRRMASFRAAANRTSKAALAEASSAPECSRPSMTQRPPFQTSVTRGDPGSLCTDARDRSTVSTPFEERGSQTKVGTVASSSMGSITGFDVLMHGLVHFLDELLADAVDP